MIYIAIAHLVFWFAPMYPYQRPVNPPARPTPVHGQRNAR